MRELLYDVEWQVLRMNCTERYSRTEGWATVSGTKNNLDKLDDYLRVHCPQEYAVRQFRVNHYLLWMEIVLTRQGKTQQLEMVKTFRNDNVRDYNVKLCHEAANQQFWRKVVYDLVVFRNENEALYTMLYSYLIRRTRRGKVQAELSQFLMLMERFLWPAESAA